jgi:1-acyl-sn-glycerol-3-phosphate acyltransferase
MNFFDKLIQDVILQPMQQFIDNITSEFLKKVFVTDEKCHYILSKYINLNEKLLKDVRYFNLEKFPEKGGNIIICNHPSCLDTGIINKISNSYCVTLNNFEYHISDDELFDKYKLISYDRSKKNGDLVKHKILELTKAGHNVIVFPEGHMSISKYKLHSFKKGLFHLAYDNNIPVVPIYTLHHNFNNDLYHCFQTFKIIYDLPIEDLNVDTTVDDLIIPSNYQSFDHFFETVVKLYKSYTDKLDTNN